MNMPKAYTGTDKFIFISYSHRDSARVFPIISALVSNGYHVWFDEGIDPGSEWDENIASHIQSCGYFIAFISNNYIDSNNCKDELNYARDLEKERLIVYLEDVTLPSGMAMRMNRLQSIFKYTYSTEADFYSKLFSAQNINAFRGESNHNTASQTFSQQTNSAKEPKNRSYNIPKNNEAPQAATTATATATQSGFKGQSIASLVLGLMSCSYLGELFFLQCIAIFVGLMAIGNGAKKGYYAMATIGIVLAFLSLLAAFLNLFESLGMAIIVAIIIAILIYSKIKKSK